MTAEIAIMNRNGVALAADSAVSIGYGGRPKIFNSVNKLFAASKRAPVGVMVFGNATLSGVPWETVIKSFRQHLAEMTFDTLTEYGDALVSFVHDTPELFDPQDEDSEIHLECVSLYEAIHGAVAVELHRKFEASGELNSDEISVSVTTMIKEWSVRYQATVSPLDELPDQFGRNMVVRYRSEIDAIRAEIFEMIPLSLEDNQVLDDLTTLFLESPPPHATSAAGLVLAGFGEREYAPSLLEYEIHGVLSGVVRRRQQALRTVSPSNDAQVVPFAQREMVDLFMSGIDPELQTALNAALSTLTAQLPSLVHSVEPDNEALAEGLRSGGVRLRELFEQELERLILHTHVSPIIQAVSSLPKEELAAMAEALVNLTSFKRRVTLDAETVGGPIDVVVISKGDGLVWMQRKHYFDPSLNHHFFANYFRYGLDTQREQ